METLHPILVHFPIALLTLYAVIEFLSLFIVQWRKDHSLFTMKLLLLIIGAVGSSVSASSGDATKHAMNMTSTLVDRHEFFAGISTGIFWGLAVFYILQWILSPQGQQYKLIQNIPSQIKKIIEKIVSIITSSYVFYLGALLGLVALTITGALGGAIVHGENVDPLVHWIVQILGA